jgi:pilus assembly protein Flp/PilA
MNAKLTAYSAAIRAWTRGYLHGEAGQGLVEYALILAMVSILVVVALGFLQPTISNTLNVISNAI